MCVVKIGDLALTLDSNDIAFVVFVCATCDGKTSHLNVSTLYDSIVTMLC